MQILFDNDEQVDIDLLDTPLADIYKKIYRHLQHVKIPFRDWDSPYYDRTDAVAALVKFAAVMKINVDARCCRDQNYLNELHKIYEKNYDGHPGWLDFHEHIHICENLHKFPPSSDPLAMSIDFRGKAGLLERKFQLRWLDHSSTQVQAGDVFVKWAELGKRPYEYFLNNEPDNLNRMIELAKPWLRLRPVITVALADYDFLKDKDSARFNHWWHDREKDWCRHWGLENWSLQDMVSILVFGRVQPAGIEKISNLLPQKIHPVRVLP